jgi:hypothetical protein
MKKTLLPLIIVVITLVNLASCSNNSSDEQKKALVNEYLMCLLIGDTEGCYKCTIESVQEGELKDEIIAELEQKLEKSNMEYGPMKATEFVSFSEDGTKARCKVKWATNEDTFTLFLEQYEGKWYIGKK